MAIGKGSDFVIYDEQFFGGVTEVLMQNSDVFNSSSNGCLQLVPTRMKGNFEREAFITQMTGLVSRRDLTSVSPLTDDLVGMAEYIGVKINRKIGPRAQTLDAWRKIAEDPETMSFVLGRQWGKAITVDYVNAAISALAAAITHAGEPMLVDNSGETDPLMSHTVLVDGVAGFGDAANLVQCYVMHSKVYRDLMKHAIADKIVEIAGMVIRTGTIETFNRPTIVVDSPSLVIAGTPTKYRTLALVAGAAEVAESEDREVVSQIITGLAQLVMRIQGEYAFNLRLKGYQWDVTNGGANPSDAAVATTTNWDLIATDVKSTAGTCILTQ